MLPPAHVLLATGAKPDDVPDGSACYGPIGTAGPTSVVETVRRYLDAVLDTPSALPTSASLIGDVPEGSVDPLGLGH